MRLIMEVHVTDGYTYDCIITYPIVAESPEAALCELEELVMEAVRNKKKILSLADISWCTMTLCGGMTKNTRSVPLCFLRLTNILN